MKVLVTGGTGLLGAHLLLKLVKEGQKPIALKRPTSDLNAVRQIFSYSIKDVKEVADLFDRIQWVDANLCDQEELAEILTNGEDSQVEQVYHCAAMVSFQPPDRKKMIDFNVSSTEAIVNACLQVENIKLVHVSSIAAVGKPMDKGPADESMVWEESEGSSGYAKSKFLSEMEVWRGKEEGLDMVIVNPGIILGPGFWDRGSSQMFDRVKKGLRFGTPGTSGYVGVKDVASAMVLLMNSEIKSERFILCEGNYSYMQIFQMIAERLRVRNRFREISPKTLQWLEKADRIISIVRRKRLITAEQVQSATKRSEYSSEHFLETGLMEFTPIAQVIRNTADCYRQTF